MKEIKLILTDIDGVWTDGGMLCINVNISDLEYLTSTIKKILGIKLRKSKEV